MKISAKLKYNDVVGSLARKYYDIRASALEKVIFTATTGRSGTLTLTKLFATVPDCLSLHEPYPIMNGRVLRAASSGDLRSAGKRYFQVKAVCIRRAAIRYRYYMEANHLFIKSFVEAAASDFRDRMEIVHLVHSPLSVANSIYRLDEFPGTPRGNYWWLDYRAPTNRVQIVDLLEQDKRYSHPFFRCLWYWFEVEARVQDWRTRLPEVRFHRFETPWFNDSRRVHGLLRDLGIRYDPEAIEARVGKREHVREEQKRLDAVPPELAREMLESFEEALRARGYGYLDCFPGSHSST